MGGKAGVLWQWARGWRNVPEEATSWQRESWGVGVQDARYHAYISCLLTGPHGSLPFLWKK